MQALDNGARRNTNSAYEEFCAAFDYDGYQFVEFAFCVVVAEFRGLEWNRAAAKRDEGRKDLLCFTSSTADLGN